MVVAVEDCLVGIGHEVAVSVSCKSRGNGFATNGELAGIKDMQAAVLDSRDGLVNLLLGAGSAGLAERSEGNGVGLIAQRI